jgi:tRNA threonylcarbamoyladenosine biosynthesis protein TsaE
MPSTPAPLGQHRTSSAGETEALAARLAAALEAGDRVALLGPLGSGKTIFVRGLARGLGIDPAEVHSPTFTRVHHHRGGRLTLVHVDLFRVDTPQGYDELGLEEETESEPMVIAFEWAEHLPAGTPPPRYVIRLEAGATENERQVSIARAQD